jgi:hypothetical protein
MSGYGRDVMASAAAAWRWPTGHTTAELEAIVLTPEEDEQAMRLIMRGRSAVFNLYRRKMRAAGLSWIGIPTAEFASLTAQRRMVRVMVLVDRPKATRKPGMTFHAPCHPSYCDGGHGGHDLTISFKKED